MSTETILDARKIPPQMKHSTIFETFDQLALNSSFVLVNDHDPKPLLRQFAIERPEQVSWEYLAQGPAEWKIKILRTSNAKQAGDDAQKKKSSTHGEGGACCGGC